jgi:ABC-type transporter Mla subunit MlaD
MGGRSRASSLAASPTMVGAITTLIVIVAVFLAYNANNGLPFVPVYRVSAEMCDSARLAPNNEVRIGGNRVGVVESIETVDLEQASGCQSAGGDSAAAAAKLNLKLDQSAKPLAEDSVVRVRYRSSFGLKYLEIQRGEGDPLPEGGNLPLAQAEEQVEFDDIGNTFDTETRESSRKVLEGFGNAFAGRGASLNQAIEKLNPLFGNLKPVSEALSDESTFLVRFFPELADAARLVAPVAVENAQLFTNGAIAFAAISFDPEALKDTISEGPETLRTGIESLPVQRPFLRDFAEFSRLLRPGVRDLRISLPVLNSTISRGVKVLPRTVQMNTDLQAALAELEELVDAPRGPNAADAVAGQTATLTSLDRLGRIFDEITSAGGKIVPAQTVCNYWNYWFQYLPEHFSGQSAFGLAERLIGPGVPGLTTPDHFPRNSMIQYSGGQGDGRYSDFYDVVPGPPKTPPAGLFDPLVVDDPAPPPGTVAGVEQPFLHGSPYGPVGTEEAPNCQQGQYGFPVGELLSAGQRRSDPIFGPFNVAEAAGGQLAGTTDLFLRQNGLREFTDSP